MKKILLALCALLPLFSCGSSEPKEFVWNDISITFPRTFTMKDQKEEDGVCKFSLVKDDDNFLIVHYEPIDSEVLAEMSDEEIRSAINEDAYGLYMADVEDENMTINQESLVVIESPEDSRPGVVYMYEGTNYGDPFKGRISITVVDRYEVIIMAEATNDLNLGQITDIITSVVKK